MPTATTAAAPTDREIVITRTFDAPPERVWRAWTDPKQIVQWWGPIGFTTTSHQMEVRKGGVWRFDMHGPDGRHYPNRIQFDVVDEPKRLEYRHTGDDDVEPVRFNVAVEFERQGDRTRLTMRMIFASGAERERVVRVYGADTGLIQTISRLAEHVASKGDGSANGLAVMLPSDREIVMTREFSARRELVWDAMTDPELVQRWMFTPPGWMWAVCEMDVRVGGEYRWEWNGPDGMMALAIWGVHREVARPSKIVHTERMEMGPGAGPCGSGGDDPGCSDPWELLATIELTEHAGRTHMRMTLLFPSKEARDGALASGMEQGVAAGYDRLDTLLP